MQKDQRSSPRLADVPWMQGMPKEVRTAFDRALRVRALQAGQLLTELGEPAQSLIGVKAGAIALHTDDVESQDIVGHIMWPGDWYGVATILTDVPRVLGSSALTDASVYVLTRSAVERLAEEHPIFWRAAAVLASLNAMLATRIARDNLLRSPTEKCTATLDRLIGRQSLPCDLPITQSQFAHICGLSRGAVAKVLSELERAGKTSRRYSAIRVEAGFRSSTNQE
ncbi:MAG: Crp/Fnr family transcriptional regulator [Roseobacter sp.]